MNQKVPVLVLAFNRADHVSEAMKAIRDYQPTELFLACDGPRVNKDGEIEAVKATQRAMLDVIDWPCNVHTLFREHNLGCANAVYEAISWFFEQEEYGIIIEDDIVMSQDFFLLCEDLLPRYKDEVRIMHISSENYYTSNATSSTYTFNKQMYCWGWASWRRAWRHMDMKMKKWPSYNVLSLIKYEGIMACFFHWKSWRKTYMNLEKSTSWATRWSFSIFSEENAVCILPEVNLSRNIGITSGGEHFSNGQIDPYENLVIGKMDFPLYHPVEIKIKKIQLYYTIKEEYRLKFYAVLNRIKKVFTK